MTGPKRPFLLSYGGGHASIVVAVANELMARGTPFDLCGLSTARAAFERAALEPMSLDRLDREYGPCYLDKPSLATAPASNHPDITDAETAAYYAIGLCDLAERIGHEAAMRRFYEQGRKAFEPVLWFEKVFGKLAPSVLVTTTSPRYELAAIKAARRLGIPSIAIGDMYLVAEQDWILAGEYADYLTVISQTVADMLTAAGGLSSRCEVLGNPAFDELAPRPDDESARNRIREELGIGERTCILWPLGGAQDEVAGRHLLTSKEAVAFLETVCAADPSLTYVIRPHPNWQMADETFAHGCIHSGNDLRDALLACDVVAVEASTVGLQAVLFGRPAICYNFADYVLYPRFGWASEASSLDEMRELLLVRGYLMPPVELRSHIGRSASRICSLIDRVAA